MQQAEGNIAEASRLLGLTPQALYKRLQRHPDLATEGGKSSVSSDEDE
jgi:DNA-binding NtrC family response regulator